jgi:hypothetical protein
MRIRLLVGTLLLISSAGCGQSSSPTAPSSSCSYVITPEVQAVPNSGGTFTATMTTTSACGWTAAADMPWIAITSGSSGVMTGTITYSVPANAGDIRRGTIAARATGRLAVTTTVIQDGATH